MTGPIEPASRPKSIICEEVEVGDIGGFGDIEELESHESRCAQTATQLCGACGRKLCGTHYELLHKDHDTNSHQETRESFARA